MGANRHGMGDYDFENVKSLMGFEKTIQTRDDKISIIQTIL